VLRFEKGWVMGIIPLFDWGEANALFLWKDLLYPLMIDLGLK